MIASADHCFVVPAYGESAYLETCLRSLAEQTLRSPIVVATSTPNAHVAMLAERHGARLAVNPVRGGIGTDWNFALESAGARWITLAHQDDVYLPTFAEKTLVALARHPDAVLAFCRYGELDGTRLRPPSTLIRIKNVLLELGFLGGRRATTRFSKTNVLRFGCAIPCPAVTLDGRTGLRFRTDLKIDLDWAAWLELARRPGAFVYLREQLMLHRVHSDSETSAGILGGVRASEDRTLLRMLWPRPIAELIASSYGIAYRSNRTAAHP